MQNKTQITLQKCHISANPATRTSPNILNHLLHTGHVELASSVKSSISVDTDRDDVIAVLQVRITHSKT